MTEKSGPGQTAKAQAEEKTAQVGDEKAARVGGPDVPDEAAAENNDDPTNPYPNYDYLTVEQLQELAESRGVEINRDVLKAHLVTELRAADSGTTSAVQRKGAR